MSGPDGSNSVTRLLARWREGDADARDALVDRVYGELRRVAGRRLRGERADHSLSPTALIHETFIRLADRPVVDWQDRAHFFAVASNLMRRILVDHARARRAEKRGGGRRRVTLSVAEAMAEGESDLDLMALDEALDRLSALDPRQGRIVELRFFAGLSIEETAEVLQVSSGTVKREWRVARAWLYHALQSAG